MSWKMDSTSWTRCLLHSVLVPFRKLWIILLFSQLWMNRKGNWAHYSCKGNKSRRRKNSKFKPRGMVVAINTWRKTFNWNCRKDVVWLRAQDTHTYIYIYIYIFVYLHVCQWSGRLGFNPRSYQRLWKWYLIPPF